MSEQFEMNFGGLKRHEPIPEAPKNKFFGMTPEELREKIEELREKLPLVRMDSGDTQDIKDSIQEMEDELDARARRAPKLPL